MTACPLMVIRVYYTLESFIFSYLFLYVPTNNIKTGQLGNIYTAVGWCVIVPLEDITQLEGSVISC